MSEWNFDKKHLKFAIEKGKLLLSKRDISEFRIKGINKEISVFDSWLDNNYNLPISKTSNSKCEIFDLKKQIMHDVKLCGGYFGKGYISLITKLVESDLFNIPTRDSQLLSVDEMANITMKTYESYSPKFFESAKKILSDDSHIQVVNDTISHAYSSSNILNEGFVVLNPGEGNGVLSYHVQDAIDGLIPYEYSSDYDRLGPILFQLLFHDKLYEEKNIKYSTDYYVMIKKIREQLNDILPILKLYIATRSSKEDEINDELFGDLCDRYFGTDNLEIVYNHIHSFICNNDIKFILSFLRAIDLRENVISNNADAFDVLSKFRDDFIYTPAVINSKFDIYNRYMDEINNKCK